SYLPADGGELDATSLGAHPQAIRSRVLRRWATRAGVPALTATHLAELDALVARWHGQARVDLPGGFGVTRVSGRLCLISPHSHNGSLCRPCSTPISTPSSGRPTRDRYT